MDWNLRFGGPIAHLDNGDLNAAGAFEYRSESFIQNEDKYSKFGEVLDFQNTVGKLTNGRRYVKSLAGELDIPIVGNKWSFPGLRTSMGSFLIGGISTAISETQKNRNSRYDGNRLMI